MQEFENKIGYQFRDRSLLQTALTHSSYVNEHQKEKADCYERLEFLGDSILGLTAAEFLYSCSPALPEGKMTRIRAELVCEESLYSAAQELRLGRLMRLGRGEENSDGRARPSVLADMVEAVIAAIYLDGGMLPAKEFIMNHVLCNAEEIINQRDRDNKTELQELVQSEPGSTIRYEMLNADGPDHRKVFTYQVLVNGKTLGIGTGFSKKEAEQAAAGSALQQLRS